MTWFIWAFLSIVAGSLERIIDKVILVKRPEKIDFLAAMFYRNLFFFIGITLIGLAGFMGELSFVFTTPFLVLALTYPLASFSYDYFLRNSELSRFGALFYAFPIFFIFFDEAFFHYSFSLIQVVGVVLLVIGAALFSINVTAKNLSFSRKGWFWMFIYLAVNVYLYTVYKIASPTVNGVSFYFSIWAMMMLLYVVLLLITKRYKRLRETANSDNFLTKTVVAKAIDSLSGVFYLQAISLASLTMVSALASLSPLVTLVLLLFASLVLRIHTAEDFSKETLSQKIVATVLLVLGSLAFFLA